MKPMRQSETRAAIRVYLVDDQNMVRAGFRSLLGKDPRFEVVGDCGDPRTAIGAIGIIKPDVVLLDITMPGLSGIDAIAHIRQVHPKARIVMLTHHEGDSFVERALAAGADGYLSKDSEPAELLLALESVSKGQTFLSPKVASVLLRRGTRPEGSDPTTRSRIDALTPREREVFQLLAQGRSNKEVAAELSMSVSTAKKHRENLQRKLACHSSAELAILAIREGLMGA